MELWSRQNSEEWWWTEGHMASCSVWAPWLLALVHSQHRLQRWRCIKSAYTANSRQTQFIYQQKNLQMSEEWRGSLAAAPRYHTMTTCLSWPVAASYPQSAAVPQLIGLFDSPPSAAAVGGSIIPLWAPVHDGKQLLVIKLQVVQVTMLLSNFLHPHLLPLHKIKHSVSNPDRRATLPVCLWWFDLIVLFFFFWLSFLLFLHVCILMPK